MGQANWTDITGTGLDSDDVSRGVSTAFTRPHSDAGSYVYAMRAQTSTTGFAGKYCNLSGFAPFTGTRKGGSIRGLMKRYASGGSYAPMMGIIKGTDPTSAEGYLLGLSEGSSYQVALRKGAPAGGLDASGSDILRTSDEAFTNVGDAAAVWFYLRMDILVNPHGEVVINVYEKDIDDVIASGFAATSWTAIGGMDQFIDDPAGVFSGSVPHLDGFYAIYGMYTEAAGSIALFDHFEVIRQTAP